MGSLNDQVGFNNFYSSDRQVLLILTSSQLQDVTKPKQEPEHIKIKKPSEAKDAKEVAKKLLKTGVIKKSLGKEKAKDVYGYGISEEQPRRTFLQYGRIVNISTEVGKNCGFITYDKVESTERAIAEVNGSFVGGVQLKVSLTRRQPVIDPINDDSSSSTWSKITASHSQKGSHRDKRDMVTYEEDIF